MKNILTIEIKDNKTVATLTKVNKGKKTLLMHKVYGSNKLKSIYMYDNSKIDDLKSDLSRANLFDSIDETYLSINTQITFVNDVKFEAKYNTTIEEQKEFIARNIHNKSHIDVDITDIKLNETNSAFTRSNIVATVEYLPSEYVREIKHQFNLRGIKITKLVPVITAISNSTKEKSTKNGTTVNVLLEEKFTQVTLMKDGNFVSSQKLNYGLTNIYDHIVEKMSITKNDAKVLFSAFGSIPPEDVVDNKIIHTNSHGKELEIFTKKNLSEYITETVNNIFANIKTTIDKIKLSGEDNVRIMFSGEITSLIGFKKYAAKGFNEKNISKFSSRIIGLKEETEFITVGILGEAREYIDQEEDKKVEKILTPKINVLKKLSRMYNYI